MTSPFNGRWALVSSENAPAYYDAINSPPEYVAKLRQLGAAVKSDPNAYIEEFTVSGNTFHRQAFVNGERKKDSGTVTFGEQHDATSGDGRPVKIKVVQEGANKISRSEVGEGFTSNNVFVVNGDELTVTLSSGSVSSTEKFKRVG